MDTGAAISLAPMGFAQHIELSPFESTLQLRSVTGEVIQAFGRRTVQLVGANLSFQVSFVIANVQHALLGMDALMTNQLSLVRNIFNEYYLVNTAGATTQLQTRGHLLYIEACPREFGFSNCRGSSLPKVVGSLLDDKGRTQEEAVAASGGACDNSFSLENLREQQAKNTATLGTTTASPGEGAKRRKKKKKKKPSAQQASQDSSQRSLEQKGQIPAAASPRSLEKSRIITEMELAAEAESNKSLGSTDLHHLSVRILLTLSLSNKWLITTTRARGACSQDALGEQLRNIGLGQNKVQPNIFSGDELVILLDQTSILIGGSEIQQECFFCELSALASLEPPKKLAQDTPISFGNMILEYKEASNNISLSVPTCFVDELLQRHDLTEVEPTQSLQEEELRDQEASEHHLALNADQKELYKQTVGDLVWLATCCRPDLSFEAHLLAQSLTSPTTSQQMQLQKVLRHLAETRHSSLSLHPATKTTREKPQSLELVAFSSTSWTEAGKATSTAYLQLWGAFLIASCKTSGAQQQELAELESMRLALGLACHIRSLLQQLDMDKLEKVVPIKLRTSSWNEELVDGRPIAKQLGLSRRNKHIQLRGQLQLSKVHPNKNLAHSLSHNASDKTMLAKLKINPEVAETGALLTVQGPCLASFLSSSSLWVGMVNLEPPKMEKPQLRQLALSDSETCNESLSKNLADKSLASLTLCSLSFQRSNFESLTLESWSFPTHSLTLLSLSRPRDRFHSLTWHSLSLKEGNSHSLTLHSLSLANGILQSLILASWSFAIASLTLYNLSQERDRLQSLTLQSLSLKEENGFEPLSFKEVSFEEGNEELDKSLAHNKMKRRAETSSFSKISLDQRELAQEAETSSFLPSLSKRTLSFRMCLRIFLLGSFHLVCAALFLKNGSFKMSFPNESFQSPTRATQLGSLQQLELSRSIFDDFDQLDLEMSLSFPGLRRISFRQIAFAGSALNRWGFTA